MRQGGSGGAGQGGMQAPLSQQSLQKPYRLLWGHMLVSEPITKARGMQLADWLRPEPLLRP